MTFEIVVVIMLVTSFEVRQQDGSKLEEYCRLVEVIDSSGVGYTEAVESLVGDRVEEVTEFDTLADNFIDGG